jgi:hypothetical protein
MKTSLKEYTTDSKVRHFTLEEEENHIYPPKTDIN